VTPRVTVGLPVYQGARYIDQAIRSIREQTYTDLSLHISDNGSTDGTEDICRRHAAEDARVHYHRSEENRGSSWNYERVFMLAEGELFKWAAHDDMLAPTHIERCVQALDADPEAVVAHTGVIKVDEEGREVGLWPPNPNAMGGRASRRFADMVMREGPCFPVFGVMRHEVLRRTGRLGPFNAHDRALLAELALHGRFVYVPQPLFLNREHADRSIRAFKQGRDRIAWFDPSLVDTIVFPLPRLALEYHRAIVRSGVSGWDRASAYLTLGRWCIAHAPGITRNVIGGVRAHVRRLAVRLGGRQSTC
jgi:glycosyltransferase involved in cell wall biosynthesis